MTATAYLTVDDGAAALDFYQRAFGFAVQERFDDNGRLAHATLTRTGDGSPARIFVSDEFPDLGANSPKRLGGSTCAVVLQVAEADVAYQQAVDAGARADRPVTDDPFGRSGWMTDPFGHRWNLRSALPAAQSGSFND